MKKLLFFVLWAVLPACSETDDTPSQLQQVQDIVQSGSWRITYYVDSGTEETTNYVGYSFVFGSSSLTATLGSVSYNGTWSITDTSTDDDSLSDLDFNIQFAAPAVLAELTDDWEILEATGSKIRLTDVSGGSGGTDFLTFEKN